MKNAVNKPHNSMAKQFYQARFNWGLIKDFNDKAKMEEWINYTKKKYSFNYEPEIKVFRKIGETQELWDVYEEVL